MLINKYVVENRLLSVSVTLFDLIYSLNCVVITIRTCPLVRALNLKPNEQPVNYQRTSLKY